jgi:hypothetical protein
VRPSHHADTDNDTNTGGMVSIDFTFHLLSFDFRLFLHVNLI